ncbi:MAG TPA: ABC transporter permease [Verrucomicrobiae bacterium]|nr:ABC transporter permease [Verrucomicrobiae bacterium]
MSRLPFELLLALRYLRPKRTFVSIITLISIVGVALGVAVLIIVISVMSGFDHDLRVKILGFNAHLRIVASGETMNNYSTVMNLVAANKNVVGVAPYVLGPVLMETEPAGNEQPFFAVPYVRGADSARENSVSVLPQSIIAGKFDLSRRGLVIGSALAQSLNLAVGDRVAIYSPDELKKMKEHQGKSNEEAVLPDDYTVTGIFDVGYYDYNYSVAVTSLANAQELYDLGASVHGLMVMLRDPYQAGVVSNELAGVLGPGYTITTWMQENSRFLGAILVEKSVMYYLLFFIVFVAAFGITCTLITFVVMKTSEIGLMKAVGASNHQVMLIFLIQSLVISILGIASGVSLGLLAIYYRNDFLHLMNRLTGFELFPASIYGFSELPAIVTARDLMVICAGSLFICLLATILPARHASKMKPVEALRYE